MTGYQMLLLNTAFAVAVFLSTYFGIRRFISWSRRKNILDIPNERSSHSDPVPVGAGLLIACSVLAAFVLRSAAGTVLYGERAQILLVTVYAVASLGIVAVSWLDDLKSVHAGVRFAVHVGCALLITIVSGVLGDWSSIYTWVEATVIIVWIVGLTNAYNFMDGIDGIAGIQGFVAGLGWMTLGHYSGAEAISSLGTFVAVSCAAFLLFNWQPAKVFMGDAGSAFLGFTLSSAVILALSGHRLDSPVRLDAGLAAPLGVGSAAVAFVWPFVFDSSFTFLRRLVNRETVWKAHRSHLYQRMVRAGWRHSSVSIIYGLLSAVGAFVAVVTSGDLVLVLAALLMISVILLFFGFTPGAGSPDSSRSR